MSHRGGLIDARNLKNELEKQEIESLLEEFKTVKEPEKTFAAVHVDDETGVTRSLVEDEQDFPIPAYVWPLSYWVEQLERATS